MSEMPNLHLELLRRNTRYRAWRAYGVPVLGGWEPNTQRSRDDPKRVVPSDTFATLRLECGTCGYSNWQPAHVYTILSAEHQILLVFQDHGCGHLSALLGTDPSEVVELMKLELLAGG